MHTATPGLLVAAAASADGIRFGIVGHEPANTGPTVLLFASSIDGAGQPPDEKNPLNQWARLERGDDFLPPFLVRASSLLRYLIDQGYANPLRVAVCGTSRCGFIAAFVPVTTRLADRAVWITSSHAQAATWMMRQMEFNP